MIERDGDTVRLTVCPFCGHEFAAPSRSTKPARHLRECEAYARRLGVDPDDRPPLHREESAVDHPATAGEADEVAA
jgi:hypothetical protein